MTNSVERWTHNCRRSSLKFTKLENVGVSIERIRNYVSIVAHLHKKRKMLKYNLRINLLLTTA